MPTLLVLLVRSRNLPPFPNLQAGPWHTLPCSWGFGQEAGRERLRPGAEGLADSRMRWRRGSC